MKARIGKTTTNNPANANPISIMGRSNKQKKNFDIPQQALMPNIISLKNTYIIAIVKSMIIASTSLFWDFVFVGIIICPFLYWIKSIISGIEYSNLLLGRSVLPDVETRVLKGIKRGYWLQRVEGKFPLALFLISSFDLTNFAYFLLDKFSGTLYYNSIKGMSKYLN